MGEIGWPEVAVGGRRRRVGRGHGTVAIQSVGEECMRPVLMGCCVGDWA